MKDAIAKVRAFHALTGQHIGNPAAIDTRRDRALQLSLIVEELRELNDALATDNDTETADAIADLAYVVIGAAVHWGIPLEPVFAEVHASNMTKTGGGRREDGKILKGPGYRPPDIAAVLRQAALPPVTITWDEVDDGDTRRKP